MRLLSSFFIFCFLFSTEVNAQIQLINEDFNAASLPSGWTTSAISGTQSWSFGTIGVNSLNGSPMAYFNDDALGAASSNNSASLTTPAFDNSADSLSFLEFDYNFRQFSGVTDSFMVEVFDGITWQRVLSVGVDDCGNWRATNCAGNYPRALIDISAFKNANCQVRFIYEDGRDWAWFVAIDNVSIYTFKRNDLSVIDYQFPNSCDLNDSLTLTLTNTGLIDQVNFPISYRLNGAPAVTYTVSAILAAGDTIFYTFPNTLNFNLGINNLIVFTDLSNEEYPLNDTLRPNFTKSSTQTLPYLEDFETSTQFWQLSGRNASWQIGSPNTTKLSNAAGGLNAAVTNLNGTYNSNELSYITSPCLQLSGISNTIRISFDAWRELELNFDGVWLEFSVNGGQNWAKVIDNSGYRSTNWYNNASAQRWDGARTNGYYHSTNIIRNVPNNAELRFRFVMSSDPSGQTEGFAFDNFRVNELPRTDVSLVSLIKPIDLSCRLDLVNPEIQIENLGADTLFDSEFFYQVNGGIIIRDSLKIPLPPGSLASFEFGQAYNFDTINTINLKIWSNAAGDITNLNDTLNSSINNSSSATINPPLNEGFRGISFGGQSSTSWTRNPNTSPNRWQTTFSTSPLQAPDGDGVYMTSRGWNSPTTGVFSFTSPCIDLDTFNAPTLQFAYANESPANVNFYLQIFSGSEWTTLDTINQATNTSTNPWTWEYRNISLVEYKGLTVKIRFVATDFTAFVGVGIDDVRIIDPNVNPIEMKNLTLDSATCLFGTQPTVSVRYIDFLTDTIDKDSLNFELYQNGNLLSTENFQNDLVGLSGDEIFVFNQNPNLNQYGPQQIKVVLKLNYKGRLYLDSLEQTIQARYNQLPYFEGFESSFVGCWEDLDVFEEIFDISNGWSIEYTDANIKPQLTRAIWHVTDTSQCYYNNDTLGSATINSCTGPNSALEGSSFIYTDVRGSDSTILYSPCFDLSNYNQAEVEYYVHRLWCLNYGVGVLKLEVRQGNNWVLIDRVDTSWVNGNAPWQKRSIDISSYLRNDLQFRFYVDSVLNFPLPPHTAIDAFKIFEPLVTDVEALETQTQTLAVYPNPNNGQFTIQVPESLIGVQYQIMDLSGKLLENANFRRSTENLQIEAGQGVYILRVPTKGINQKVVVY
jgi:hypothetical protein